MLSLPEAAARETGLGSASVLVAVMVALAGKSFVYIGRACEAIDKRPGSDPRDSGDFYTVWKRTVGARSARLVDPLVLFYAVATSIFYIPMTYELLRPLLAAVGAPEPLLGFPLRAAVAAILFCLGQLRDLKNMTWTSSLGNTAVAVSLGVIMWRSFDGSYLPGGRFWAGGQLTHAASPWSVGPSTALLALRLSYAMSCHYNAPRFYAQLRDRSAASFETAARWGFGAAAMIYMALIACAVRTFGVSGCRVPILSSYAAADPLASLARWMLFVSSITIYPLIFSAAELPSSMLLRRIRGRDLSSGERSRAMLGLSTAVGFLGLFLHDLGTFSSLMGAFFCAMFVWIMPAALGVVAVRTRNGRRAKFVGLLGPCVALMIGVWQLFYGTSFILKAVVRLHQAAR